jgi:hypothetical protein
MTSPADPTAMTIVTEGLTHALSGQTPTPGDIVRAKDWLEEVKNDIVRKEKRLKSLYFTSADILTEGISLYSNPSDYGSDLTFTLMKGETTGTAQAGAAGSLTLESDEDITEANILGKELLVTGGTGENSISQVSAYDTSTLIASVTPDFVVTPGTDPYMVVDTYKELNDKAIRLLDQEINPTIPGEPVDVYMSTDNSVDKFTVRPVPDATFGLKLRYYVNLMTLDLDSTLMSRLYRKWRNVFTQGVYAKKLAELDDDRRNTERNLYNNMLIELLVDEVQYAGEDIMQIGVDVPDFSSRV